MRRNRRVSTPWQVLKFVPRGVMWHLGWSYPLGMKTLCSPRFFLNS
jgi:hypothetical protein